MHVAEPVQAADSPAVLDDAPVTVSAQTKPVTDAPPQEDEWRWTTHPGDISIPTPTPSRTARPSDALIRAFTQLGLQAWR
jgi:hypothetical protein